MTYPESGIVSRTICQIVDKDGTPYKAYGTENIWLASVFSKPTDDNSVKPFFTGKTYFRDLINEFAQAKESIYIAGWQVNWDAQMAPGVRLFDCLLEAAKRGVKIYVMPWNDSAPVQTFDDQTHKVLTAINRIIGKTQVYVTLSSSMADHTASFFSHHQKQVVIDECIAYVGGLDLAYGRYDDEHYDPRADSDGREGMNRYNGCVPHLGHIISTTLVNPNLLENEHPVPSRGSDDEAALNTIKRGAYQTPYKADNPTSVIAPDAQNKGLDPSRQPRMPWQDIHLRIEGPAVSDLTRNFVLRWGGKLSDESAQRYQQIRSRMPAVSLPLTQLKMPLPPDLYPATEGKCSIQVLRSAPLAMQKSEPQDIRDLKPKKAQDDIQRAMELLIDKAHHFIYIEQQFFVSDFGQEIKDNSLTSSRPSAIIGNGAGVKPWATTVMPMKSKGKIENKICKRLIQRIGKAVMGRNPFHVYIVLPVHPEGAGLDDPAIVTQVHWTQQTIAFGTQSLLNGVRDYIKVRRLLDDQHITCDQAAAAMERGPEGMRAMAKGRFPLVMPSDEDCFEYVTLLNLRNWAKLGSNRYVTEQIYVHSKMMIVDDRFALVGSANINDRSLLGDRDSELAVLLVDQDIQKADFLGDGKLRNCRSLARELRMGAWCKMFGITSGTRPADELKDAIEKPGCPESWRAIQAVAKRNTKHYEAVFSFIPRNKDPSNRESKEMASIWPNWNTAVQVVKGGRINLL
jgi:phospholipase D1/2